MICVGGTFDRIHRGHRALLEKAFSFGEEVCIGLSSDDFASKGRDRAVKNYEERLGALESYLRESGRSDYRIFPLNDEIGEALDPKYTDIVVSEGTARGAEKINRLRMEKGIKPLRVHTVPYVLADNFLPISSTAILRGDIDEEGKLLRPLKVNVGSENPNKLNAVRKALSDFYESADVRGMAADTGVPEQPFGKDTLKGAVNRAKNALGGADLGIGIEAGLMKDVSGKYFDVQYCAIIDRMGWVTMGHGPGFYYPRTVMELIEKGMSVGEAMESIFKVKGIGYSEGAVGLLSEGKYTREKLTESAVYMAFIPRIRKEIYRK